VWVLRGDMCGGVGGRGVSGGGGMVDVRVVARAGGGAEGGH